MIGKGAGGVEFLAAQNPCLSIVSQVRQLNSTRLTNFVRPQKNKSNGHCVIAFVYLLPFGWLTLLPIAPTLNPALPLLKIPPSSNRP